MKHTFALFGTVGLVSIVLTSFTSGTENDLQQEPKKSRHIKMTKIENGKKLELDTVFTNDDVFVWNGDTINPPKHSQKIGSGNKMQHSDVKVYHQDGKEEVMIIKHRGGKPGEPMIWNMDSGEDMEIVTEDVDSLGKRIVVRKQIKDGEFDNMYFFDDGDLKHFQPMAPMPPVSHMRMHHSGKIIDLNDPNVISYKKKDLKDGREKIEIIRKKTVEPEESTFNFEFDEEMIPPPPPPSPDAPEIEQENN